MYIVTPYDCPDLDGIASAIGFAELSNKLGKKAKAVYSGSIGKEVNFVPVS